MSENSRCDSLGTRSLSLPGGEGTGPADCLSLSLLPRRVPEAPGLSPGQGGRPQKPVQKIGRTPSGENRSATPEARIFPEAPGRRRLAENGSLAQRNRKGPVRHPVAPIPYCTGFFDKITAETAGKKQDSRGGAWRERRECGREKRKDWRTLLFFRPLLAPSGPVPGRPRPSLLLGERMRRPGPIPGVGGPQTKSLGQERREGRSRVVATGVLPALKRSWAGKGPTSRRRELDLPDSDPATDWTKASIPPSSPRHVTLSASGDTLARPRNNEDAGGIFCLTPWWGERARKNPAPMAPRSPPPPSPRPSAPRSGSFPARLRQALSPAGRGGGRPASTQEEPSDPSRPCHDPPRAFFLMILSYALDKRLQLEDLSGLISHSKNEGKNFPLSPLSPGSGKVRTLRSFLKLFPSTGR